jgi:N-acetylmuramoyl-L-alanine amidase
MKAPNRGGKSCFTLGKKGLAIANSGFVLLILVLILLTGCQTTETHKTRSTFRTVVIDPGHGGHDSGANPHTILPEKFWTLEVGRRLERNLKRAGFRVVMTRSDDTFIPLDDRVSISNRQRDAIFVSIHFNYTSRRSIHGLETYYTTTQSVDFARVIHSKILEIPGLENRGIILAHYRVIRNNAHPAILIEGGYLTNHEDAARISSPAFLEALARKISDGIVKYRGSAPAGAQQ